MLQTTRANAVAISFLVGVAAQAGCGDGNGSEPEPVRGTLTVRADPAAVNDDAQARKLIDCIQDNGVKVLFRRPLRNKGGDPPPLVSFWYTESSQGLTEDPSDRYVNRTVRKCSRRL